MHSRLEVTAVRRPAESSRAELLGSVLRPVRPSGQRGTARRTPAAVQARANTHVRSAT
jgi:hypothetical protein